MSCFLQKIEKGESRPRGAKVATSMTIAAPQNSDRSVTVVQNAQVVVEFTVLYAQYHQHQLPSATACLPILCSFFVAKRLAVPATAGGIENFFLPCSEGSSAF